MWSADDGPFEGKHYRLAETLCSPQPLHRPRVLIGGTGEKKTLRLVAQYADACNLFAGADPAGTAAKLQVLERHCADVGRDPAEVDRTILYVGPLDDAFLPAMEAYAALGVSTVHVMPPAGPPEQWVAERLAPVVPRLRDL